jgi:hypothetical protein
MIMRTPEQVTADDALTAAIEGVLVAYGWDQTRLLTDYVVCTVRQSWGSDGDQQTEYAYLVRDEALPDYRIVGLLESIRDRFRARMMED